MTVTLLYRFYD